LKSTSLFIFLIALLPPSLIVIQTMFTTEILGANGNTVEIQSLPNNIIIHLIISEYRVIERNNYSSIIVLNFTYLHIENAPVIPYKNYMF